MADRGDTHYHVPTLNLWFLGSSAFFLLTMVWTVIDDWDAEWKNHQRDFRNLELQIARAEEANLEAQGAMKTEEELQAAAAEAVDDWPYDRGDGLELSSELMRWLNFGLSGRAANGRTLSRWPTRSSARLSRWCPIRL